jgi:hypothetical protein
MHLALVHQYAQLVHKVTTATIQPANQNHVDPVIEEKDSIAN